MHLSDLRKQAWIVQRNKAQKANHAVYLGLRFSRRKPPIPHTAVRRSRSRQSRENRRTTIGANSYCHEGQAALPGTCPAGIGGDPVSLHQANHVILDQYGLVQAEGQAGEWAQASITFLLPFVSMI